MKKILLPIMLVMLFLFPIFGNIVSATSITPVLKETYTGDMFGSYATSPDSRHFVVNNSGTLSIYYVHSSDDEKLYKFSGGAQTTVYSKAYVYPNDYHFERVIRVGDYVYILGSKSVASSGVYYPLVIKINLDGTEFNVDTGSAFGSASVVHYIKSDIIVSDNKIYWLTSGNNLNEYTISTHSITVTATGVSTTHTGFGYLLSGTNNIGFIVFDNVNTAYSVYMNVATHGITKTTFSIGTSLMLFDGTTPARVIEDSLNYNEAGAINGRVTIFGAPNSGTGLLFYNFYCIGGSWSWEVRQYSPAGYSYATKGCVWAYHDGEDLLSLTWYKDAYTSKQLYTATINYAGSGAISSISCTVDPTTTEYPLSTQTVWATEFFIPLSSNYTLNWYYNHGYYPSTCGNYRVEFYAYGGTFTAFYSISGETTETAEQPSGFYDIGGLDITNTYNTSDSVIYYIRQSFAGNVTLSRISVLINETFVNATCNHTFAYVIWLDNVLIYFHNATTSTNSTTIYYDVIDELIATGGVVRAGFVSWGDNILGVPLGVGYSASNTQTYSKSYSGVADDLATQDWTYEGNSMAEKLAIQVQWYSNYVAPQYDEDGGDSGFSIVNGTIVINTNVNGSISETDIIDQSTPIGTAILNAFSDWGYGATAGGYILWVCFILGITMLMTKCGVGGMGAVMTGFIGSSFVCGGLGLVGATIIILSILIVIVLASKEIVGLVRGG